MRGSSDWAGSSSNFPHQYMMGLVDAGRGDSGWAVSTRDFFLAMHVKEDRVMSDQFVTLDEIMAAKERIAGGAVRTPLFRVERARLQLGKFPEPEFDLYIKAESEQPIGSFKLRGAYNMVSQLSPEALQRGVITYSSGNHAQGVAYAARALGAKAVIVMPSNATEVKKAATRALGAEIVEGGPASSDRWLKAGELVGKDGYAMIPPYDAPQIIAGQATCGL